MAFKPRQARTYTLAVVNYGITRGGAEGTDDVAGAQKEMANWAKQAAAAAKVLAETETVEMLRVSWRVEVAYWTDIAAKHTVLR